MEPETDINDVISVGDLGKYLLSSATFTFKAISLLFRFFWVFGVLFVKNFRTAYSTVLHEHVDAQTETDENVVAENNQDNMDLSIMNEIKLKVGGKCFEVAAADLRRFDCFFSRMIESNVPQKLDEDGYVVIERDSTHFDKILKFMETGAIDFPSDPYAVRCIQREADFYQIQELIKECEKFLDGPQGRCEACLRAVFTYDERNAAIATRRPIVFLCVGMLNNLHVLYDNASKTITESITQFIKNRTKFPEFFFIIDYSYGHALSMDFYYDGALVKKLNLYVIENNQCTTNIDFEMSSAFTMTMAKMLEAAGFGRAMTEDGQLALTL